MERARVAAAAACVAACVLQALDAAAQVARADYDRALAWRDTVTARVANLPEPASWIGETHRFVYRKAVKGGHQFVMADATTLQKRAAFDHARLAAALNATTGSSWTALTLPFNEVRFVDEARAIEFSIQPARWTCTLADYRCTTTEGPVPPGALRGVNGPVRGPHDPPSTGPKPSPDGRWVAVIQNYNVAVRPAKGGAGTVLLSTDGSEGDAYELDSVVWSPDSTRLAAYRVRPGYRRLVHYVESSPEDQLQPRHWTLQYAKPGDVLDREALSIFQVEPAKQIPIARELTPNPYELSAPVWRKDGRAVTFEYNERGHRVYRVLEADATTGAVRAVISEEPRTFFYYNAANDSRSSGKRFRHDVDDGREVVWMSERDGWNHLYLFDGATGAVKNQITNGQWAVRGVQKVDDATRQIWFSAGGMYPGRDPYLLQYYRINFDGSGLTALTDEHADHQVAFSHDMAFFVDTYSRVDLPPVSELRRTSDRSLLAEIERGDISELVKWGWKPPEVLTAKGRDGTTDIWGLIFRPSSFDPTKKYPVIENIYAGPHGSHVPKRFSAYSPSQAQAELGFIVVQIDGMGTSNRSKAFHDVAWQNLGDAGFPDRILWHRAAAAKYRHYDITRVGIFGGSAGGQNAMRALLFHPELYKVAVSYAGCHDNRMDKIWWNEQWMGWPIGPQYSASSNVDHAARLQGRLLLVVGELDTNVDPASTMQVVSALVKAGKVFDLLVVPGANHGAGRSDDHAAYGDRKRFDFFVQHLAGHKPPDWNGSSQRPTSSAAR
ncbi:MAG: prolyl oligopeptidase family serine peptidase [Vicinamibacterales bacterium]